VRAALDLRGPRRLNDCGLFSVALAEARKQLARDMGAIFSRQGEGLIQERLCSLRHAARLSLGLRQPHSAQEPSARMVYGGCALRLIWGDRRI